MVLLSLVSVALRSASTTCVPAETPVTWAFPSPTVPTVTVLVVTASPLPTTCTVARVLETMVNAEAGTVVASFTVFVVTATSAWESCASACGGSSTVMMTGYVGLLLVLSAGRIPIWVTIPLITVPPPAGVTAAVCPTASVGIADNGASTVI